MTKSVIFKSSRREKKDLKIKEQIEKKNANKEVVVVDLPRSPLGEETYVPEVADRSHRVRPQIPYIFYSVRSSLRSELFALFHDVSHCMGLVTTVRALRWVVAVDTMLVCLQCWVVAAAES